MIRVKFENLCYNTNIVLRKIFLVKRELSDRGRSATEKILIEKLEFWACL